jgi:BirA family biotin operon repressor/biotin-[acetyl-CoA-carboxylase] ligase
MRGDRARSALAGTRFADVRWVSETGSTNRDVLELAARGAPEGVVVVADHQQAGRGRLDRSWHAPPRGSLLMSILFRPSLAVADAHRLTTAAGVSAAQACRSVSGIEPRLKWPNDLVIDTDRDTDPGGSVRKLGGILAESTVEGGELQAVVVGIGLNVNWPSDLPTELAEIATALNHLTGYDLDREDLLIALLAQLDHWSDVVLAPSGDRASLLMDQARAWSATLGRQVRVDLGVEQVEGEALELTDDGALVVGVGTAAGLERRVIVAGDVVHLRPTD